MQLSRTDRRLLAELQRDTTRNQSELAELVGMSRTSCWRRIRDFEEAGLIEKQVALLNPNRINSLNREAIYWHFPHYRHAPGPYSIIRAGKWKMIHFYEPGTNELFDLAADLGETTDLADKRKQVVRRLSEKLFTHLEAVGAKMPRPNPDYKGK